MVQLNDHYNNRLPDAFSTYLNLVRVVATGVVIFSHIPFTTTIGYFFSRNNFGYDSVVIFFVLSGYVISYASEQIDKTLSNYALNRFVRIFPVAFSSIILSFLIAKIGFIANPNDTQSFFTSEAIKSQLESPVKYILAASTFTNEIWWNDIRPFENGPYWSLSYEVASYVIYGALFFLNGKKKYITAILLALFFGPKILIMFFPWMLGSMAYHFRDRFPITRKTALILSISPVLIYFSLQLYFPHDWSYKYSGQIIESWIGHGLDGAANFGCAYLLGMIMAVNFYCMRIILSNDVRFPFSKQIHELSTYSFSAYIIHHPIYFLLNRHPGSSEKIIPTYIIIFISIYLFSKSIEQKKGVIKKAILRIKRLKEAAR